VPHFSRKHVNSFLARTYEPFSGGKLEKVRKQPALDVSAWEKRGSFGLQRSQRV
jgi:hypothetical protein